MTHPQPAPGSTHIPTRDQALTHAARLLHTAEAETDRGLMERYNDLADSWMAMAAIIHDGL